MSTAECQWISSAMRGGERARCRIGSTEIPTILSVRGFKGAIRYRRVKVRVRFAIQNIREHAAVEAIGYVAIERISDLRVLVHGVGNSHEGFFECLVFTRSDRGNGSSAADRGSDTAGTGEF